MKKIFWTLVGLLVVGLSAFAVTFSFNFSGNGFISDGAEIIDKQDRSTIDFYLDYVSDKTSYQVLVVTLETLYGVPAGKVAKSVSENCKNTNKDNVLVFLVSPHESKIGIDIGENLKSNISYIALKNVIQEEVTPLFNDGEYSVAIRQGVFNIAKIIEPSVAFIQQENSKGKHANPKFPLTKKEKEKDLPENYSYIGWLLLALAILIPIKLNAKKHIVYERCGFGNTFEI